MLLGAWVGLLVSVSPLEAELPAAKLNVRPGESTISTVIGLDFVSSKPREEAARELLTRHARSFGLEPFVLTTVGETFDSTWSTVRFARTLAGVPVQHGELVVSFDGRGHAVMIHAGPQLPPARGAFVLPESYALAKSPGRAHREWVRDGEQLRPAWVVDETKNQQQLQTIIDAQTGVVLTRQRIEWSVSGDVFDFSPVRSAAALCAQNSDGGYTNCASTVSHVLGGLDAGATSLSGPRLIARNCQGAAFNTSCVPHSTPTGGSFLETPNFANSNTDKFGEVMTYYQGDSYSAWLDGLSPAFKAKGGLGQVDVFTNVGGFEGGFFHNPGPFNRFAIRLGQGPLADWAYDADVLWHELGHGMVAKTSGFGFYSKDVQGIFGDSGSLNEGTADCMSLAHKGTGQLGEFTGSALMLGGQLTTPYLRTVEAKRTCQIASIDATTLALGGRVGEIHADGVIWGSFFWTLRQKLAGVSTTGLCVNCNNAAEAVLIRAMDSTASGASFNDATLAVQQVAASVIGAQAGQLVGCLSCDFDMKSCDDRTRIVYPGETHEALLDDGSTAGGYNGQTPATFQYALDVAANTTVTFNRFAIESGTLTLYARFNQKVAWTSAGVTASNTITAQNQTLPPQATAGRWYIQGAHDGAMNRRFGFRVGVVPAGPARPAPAAFTCSLGSGIPVGCNCTPQCTGKTCGSDGCGGSCGTCPGAQTCNATGTCGCTPQCAGKTCGADGCGGSCGTCPGTQTCSASGTCACVPNCSGKACGDDGCGNVCGTCPSGQSCTAAGTCMPGADPCAGRVCGPDGLGGSCGICAKVEEDCTAAGTCVASGSCGVKLCGPNGIGGSCGTCDVGESCGTTGFCSKDETPKGGCGCGTGTLAPMLAALAWLGALIRRRRGLSASSRRSPRPAGRCRSAARW